MVVPQNEITLLWLPLVNENISLYFYICQKLRLNIRQEDKRGSFLKYLSVSHSFSLRCNLYYIFSYNLKIKLCTKIYYEYRIYVFILGRLLPVYCFYPIGRLRESKDYGCVICQSVLLFPSVR